MQKGPTAFARAEPTKCDGHHMYPTRQYPTTPEDRSDAAPAISGESIVYTALFSLGAAIACVFTTSLQGTSAGVNGGMFAVAVAIGLALDHERAKRKAQK